MASLLCERLDLELALQAPRFAFASVPDLVRQSLGLTSLLCAPVVEATLAPAATTPHTPPRSAPATLLDEAVRAYLAHVADSNAAMHVENKLSMLRRLLGIPRVAAITSTPVPRRKGHLQGKFPEPFFRGQHLSELTTSVLQGFFQSMNVSVVTKRHYRQFLHHFFEFTLKFALYEPANWHCPNPVAALPSFVSRNRRIVFLRPEDIARQLVVLQPTPALAAAAMIMIHAGLRREEALWLTKDSLSPDLSFLSVTNRVDESNREESSLKTGERTVGISPLLRAFLESYLPHLQGPWLVPTEKHSRWDGNAFGRALRLRNAEADLPWTSLHFRHTYATQRAAEGWSLFHIAKEMGNSAVVVEKYYAGFVRPAAPVVRAEQSKPPTT